MKKLRADNPVTPSAAVLLKSGLAYLSLSLLFTLMCQAVSTANEITYTITGRIEVPSNPLGNPWGLELGSSDTEYSISMTFDDKEYAYTTGGYGDTIDVYANTGFIRGSMTLGNETAPIETGNSVFYMRFAESFPQNSQTFNLVNFTFRVTLRDQSNIVGGVAVLEQPAFNFDGGTAKLPELSLQGSDFNRDYGLFGAYTYITTSITCDCNSAPIADSGPDQVLDCTNPDGATVTLDGTASTDPDGDELSYEWSVPSGVVLDDATSPTPTGTFPIGITTATLTVTDGNGGLDFDDVVITVVDATPPEVAATTDIGAIWPPNHRMIPVTVCVYATDDCSAPERLILGSVTIQSSEPDDAEGLGDGETIGDVDGQDGYTAPVDVTELLTYDPETASFVGIVWLRAERDGDGLGRAYSINASVLDSANNIAQSSCVVVVPHDRRKER